MLNKFLRENVIAAYGLLILRLYIGYEWMTAGWGKITGGAFDTTGFLKGAIGKASGEHPAVQTWWANFLESFALPNADLFTFLVQWGEFLVGLGLILGCFTTLAALMGMVMNFAFLFSGTVSTNAQMVALTIFIVAAGANAGRFGVDRYMLPALKALIFKNRSKEVGTKTALH